MRKKKERVITGGVAKRRSVIGILSKHEEINAKKHEIVELDWRVVCLVSLFNIAFFVSINSLSIIFQIRSLQVESSKLCDSESVDAIAFSWNWRIWLLHKNKN